jgi:undecaprenyl pyrophosphate phosphatase UppP
MSAETFGTVVVDIVCSYRKVVGEMLFIKKRNVSKRDLFLIRSLLQIVVGSILLITSGIILKRALLCLCPSQFLLLAGLLISGIGLIVYSIHMIREDNKLRKLESEI